MATKKSVFDLPWRLKLVVFSLLMSEFVRSLGYNLYTISLPLLAQSLTTSTVLVGLAISMFGFVNASTQLSFGKFSDKHGRRGILLVTAFIYAGGALLVSLSDNIYEFIFFRGVQAVGALMSVLQACLGDIFPPERRGTAMAWFSIVYAIGTIVGLPLGIVVAGLINLRMPFYVGAALAFISAGILVVFLRETHPTRQGTPVSALGQENKSPMMTNGDPVPVPVLASQAVPGNAVMPVPMPSLHSIKGFIPACIVGMLVNAVPGAFFAFAPTWLESLKFTILDMIWIFIPGIAIFFCGAFLSGVLSDRLGRKRPVVFGLCLGAPCALLIPPLSGVTVIGMIPFVMLMMLGVAIAQPPLSALVLDLVDKSIRGRATGIYNTLTIFGNASGALLAGVVASTLLGVDAIFLLAACLLAFGIVLGQVFMPDKGTSKGLKRVTS
jgi:MFS family permease